MIVFLDTSTPICRIGVDSLANGNVVWHEWQADRELAKGLLGFIENTLLKSSHGIKDIKGIGVYKGPGSFTGLRIGITVANTLADSLSVPIVGTVGDAWVNDAQARLSQNESDQIVLPEYGSEARITTPRK